MTGGVNYGGGHRTRLREQLMCYGVPPAPIYEGGEEEAAGLEVRAKEGVLLGLPVLVGFPFPFPEWERGKGRGSRRGKGGRRPLP